MARACSFGIAGVAGALVLCATLNVRAGDDRNERLIVSDRTRALILNAIRSEDPRLRSLAAGALSQLQDASVAERLRPLLRDEHPAVRADAFDAIAALVPSEDSLGLAVEFLGDSHPLVVRRALNVLAASSAETVHAALMRGRDNISEETFPDWAQTLARRPEAPPAEVVVELLADRRPAVRVAGATLLARHSDLLSLDEKLKFASDDQPLVRAHAIAALSSVFAEAKAQERILEGLSDRSPFVRRASLKAMVGPLAVNELVKVLNDDDSTVRHEAVLVASRGPEDDVRGHLIERLGDIEVLVAQIAAEQLAAIGSDAVEHALQAELANTDEQVAEQAARALGLIGRRSSLESLQDASAHRSTAVRRAAYESIGRMADAREVAWLLERVANETGLPRAAINDAFGAIGDTRAVEHLLADCQFPDKQSRGLNAALFTPMSQPAPYSSSETAVATAAVRALGRIGDPRGVSLLVTVADDVLRDEAYWTAVAKSLSQLGDPGGEPALVRYAIVGQISQGPLVLELPDSTRSEAMLAIANLKLTHLVEEILKVDGARCSFPVRRAAADALSSLTGQTYVARIPMRLGQFFVEDRSAPPDVSALTLPICYIVP